MNASEQRWTDLISIGLLIGIHWSLSQRLLFTQWDENIFVLGYLISLGTLLGFLLGYSRFSIRISSLLCFIYGLIIIPWQLVLLMPEKVAYMDRLFGLYGRLAESIRLLRQSLPLEDAVLFLLMMAFITWLLSAAAAFQLIRSASPWPILIIEGTIVLLIEYYNYYKIGASWFSALFFIFLLFLLGRSYFLKSHNAWQSRGVKTDSEVGFDMSKATIFAGLFIVLFAWSIPSFTQAIAPGTALRQRLGENWQNFSTHFSNLVSPLASPLRVSNQSFENIFRLGTGAELGDALVLESHITTSLPENTRFYWRSQIFDRYADDQWQTTLAVKKQIEDPRDYIPLPDWNGRQEFEFAVTSHLPLTSIVYAPALPYAVSRPIEVIYRTAEEDMWDVAGVTFEDPIQAGEFYHVASLVSTPSVAQLRAASNDYPEWVIEHYLQLPDNLSHKIILLAQEITLADATNYDRVISITQYLRNEIEYREVIPSPPDRADPIEWFLFEQRTGFCNYYATAEILMLRSIGIPARLAVGYAQGQWVPENNSFFVYQRDGHAWPEVYFSDVGWVEFEPTVSQPSSSFPAGNETNEEALDKLLQEDANSDFQNPFLLSEEEPEELLDFNPDALESISGVSLAQWTWLFILIAFAAGIIAFSRIKRAPRAFLITSRLSSMFEKRGIPPPHILTFLNSYLSLTAVERSVIAMRFALWLHRLPALPSQTAAEQAQLIVQHIPEAAGPVNELLYEYQISCFSQHPANIQEAKKVSGRIILISIKSRLTHLYKKYILDAL